MRTPTESTLTAGELWAVGERSFQRFDGRTWTVDFEEPHIFYSGVCSSSSEDVWAVGGGAGPILHWDGCSWKPAASPVDELTNFALYAVWGASADEVWAVGNYGKILRFR